MKNWFDFDKDGTEDNKEVITENIKTLEVDLEVDLGRSLLTIEDFLHLELGDIIKLDKRIDDPLKMYVEDRIHFLVKPGKVDNRFAVEILQYIEEDVE